MSPTNLSTRLARYLPHDSKGFGAAPLSAQAEIALLSRLRAVVQVTSGVAWFNKVVPYGNATQGNFTVSPSVALQWDVSTTSRLAVGYTLHHMSNMAIGYANPGMNSHILLARFTSRHSR